ncbi:MAG: hypothetical protein JNG90_03895 [Planctomycetaceae bacterium]|nr:hypothetical protein [Planctomycetaceae bacterium]
MSFALAASAASAVAQDDATEDPADAAAAAEAPAAPPAPVVTDPAALAVLETKPTTPAERIQALLVLIKLKQAAAGRPIAAELVAAQPDDAAWSQLVAEFGPGAFIKIALEPGLEPEGRQLADLALGAVDRLARDPARLEQAVRDLSDAQPAVRQTAVAQLRRSGLTAAAPLLRALADPARDSERPEIRSMLVHLGPVADAPLISALSAADARLQVDVADVLGQIGASAALPALIPLALSDATDPNVRTAARQAIERIAGPVPTRPAGAAYLYRQALASYRGDLPLEINVENQAMLWSWNSAQNQPEAQPYLPAVARTQRTLELARQALALDPSLSAAASLYWAALIERDAHTAGLDQPLPAGPKGARELLAQRTPAELSQLLADCLAERRTIAAAAIARQLGETGSAAILSASGTRPAPLVAAAGDADRRVRFAALGAIIQLAPLQSFAGASEIPRALEYFIGSLGSRGAVVAAPRSAEAARLAGLLAQAGFEPQIATDKRGLFQHASQMSDCEVVLIDVRLTGAAEAIAELRRDPRTAELPVAIVAPPEHDERAHDLARHDSLSAVWIRPLTRAGVDGQLASLSERLAVAGIVPQSPALRFEEAAAALDWLAALLQSRTRIYDLRALTDVVERALHVPQLAVRAATVLGELPSPQAQLALVEAASLEVSSLEPRQAAAEAFAESVARFGILLTTSEMRRQYERYNASEFKDQATQELLAGVLDTLERGRAPLAGRERLAN